MIYIQESWRDATNNILLGESDIYETGFNRVKDLFRNCQITTGRCIGSIRVEPDGKKIGWVFQKVSYSIAIRGSYSLETSVTLHEKEPTITVENHYLYL